MLIKHKSLATPMALDKIDLNECIVIDIRSKGYFLISHVQNALHIESPKRISYIAKENPDKKILLYCHSGASAAEFGNELVHLGCQNIYYIDENYFNIPKAGIPLEKSYK